MALPDAGPEYAGHYAADVQNGHETTPAEITGRLTLHAGETPQSTAAWWAEKHFNSILL